MADKYRHWVFLLYPDSAIDNWLKVLEGLHLRTYVSPLHNMDVNDDGTTKKPHYHILISFDGPTTFKNVCKYVCEPLNATIPKICLSVRGSYDYFIHLHNHDKYPYDKDEIIYLNGASEKEVDNETYVQDLFYRIEQHIFNCDVTSFKSLVLRCRQYNNPDINSILRKNVIYFRELLRQ